MKEEAQKKIQARVPELERRVESLYGLLAACTVCPRDCGNDRLAGVLAVLPMITPPFVIGLALIMLFGRSGAINAVLEWAFAVSPTR